VNYQVVFVKLRPGETLADALKRFKRDCERNGILKEIKKREFHTPRSVVKKLKAQEAQRRLRKSRSRSYRGF